MVEEKKRVRAQQQKQKLDFERQMVSILEQICAGSQNNDV